MYPQSDPHALESWIREQIKTGSPVTFAQFMEWALYHPSYGYYSAGPNIGPRGDFTTSPEASRAFGRLLARHVQEVDSLLGRPAEFDVIECGPGTGKLAVDLLDTMALENPDLYGRLQYRLVEISGGLVAVQRERLLPRHSSVVKWRACLDDLPPGEQGAVIANELVDAFPVHVIENRDGIIVEQFVTVGEEAELALCYLPPSGPELPAFLEREEISLAPGERLEINLAAGRWLGELASVLDRGVVAIIDYGDEAPGRYSEARRQGTLLGYYGGAVTDNVLARPGKQDLTALVDFTALQQSASESGFEVAGMTRQSHFLLGLGLGTTHTAESATSSLDEAIEYRRGLQALVSMEGLGRFHVLVLARNIEAQQAAGLSGLKYMGL